jgi:hypothetical protein
VALAALIAAAGPSSTARGAIVRFRAESLAGGGAIPAHASASGDVSDGAAARRRAEIVRSPYLAIEKERSLRGGEIRIGFERAVSEELRERLSAGATAFAATLEREGWSRVGSLRAPLLLYVTGQKSDLAAAGWDGREAGLLVRPVVSVPAGEGDATAALLQLAHQMALLSLRQSAPEAAPWAVEGTAEFLARRALGLEGDAVPAEDPFLAETGSLGDPASLAEFLPLLVRRLPRGIAELRAAWEEAGASRAEDAESLLRSLAARGDARGIPGLLGDLLVRHLARTAVDDPVPGGRRPIPSGGLSAAAPPPMGWRRVTLRTADEGGGIELLLPDKARCATGRVLVGYRGESDGFDATDLVPGIPRRLPLSGTVRLGVILVDGAEPGDVLVELGRLPDYPAALSASSAEWNGEAVHLAWRTAWHRDLLAWIVSRTDESEGESREPERRIVPTSESDEGGFAYQLDDAGAQPGHRYHYRVFALTTDGILSEAFDASVIAGR